METINCIKHKKKGESILYADKGYRSKKHRELARDLGYKLIAPTKKNEKCKQIQSETVNHTRYVVESSYSWMKNHKQLILRYDRHINMYESFLYISFAVTILTKIRNF